MKGLIRHTKHEHTGMTEKLPSILFVMKYRLYFNFFKELVLGFQRPMRRLGSSQEFSLGGKKGEEKKREKSRREEHYERKKYMYLLFIYIFVRQKAIIISARFSPGKRIEICQ